MGVFSATIFEVNWHASVVQWIERQIPVLKVGGSSPFGRAKTAVTYTGSGCFVFMGGSFRFFCRNAAISSQISLVFSSNLEKYNEICYHQP